MDETTAAAYLGVGATSFRVLAARNGLQPVALELRLTRWRKADLDRFVSRLASRDEVVEEPGRDDVLEREQARALEAVEIASRRGRRRRA